MEISAIKQTGLFRLLLSFFIMMIFLDPEVRGQEMGDTSLYNPGLQMIREAKTENDYLQASAYFEDLSARKAAQWLPYYYAALCHIQASYRTESGKSKDALLDKAQPFINKAFQLKPGEAELWVLQAFLYQSRIQVNPSMRGLSFSTRADSNLKKAVGADEGNPRAWSLMGYNVFHTPAMFGGGPGKALPLFLKARDKYQAFRPVLPFMPGWGETENQLMISECRKNVK